MFQSSSIRRAMSGKTRTSTLLLVFVVSVAVLWFAGVLGGPANQKEAGMMAWREGRLEAATKAFARFLAGEPEDPEAQYFMAICLSATREDDRALDTLNSLSRFDAWAERAHYHTVRVLLSRQRTEEARRVVTAAAESIKQSALGREAEGLFHLAQAKLDEDQVFELLTRDIGEVKARSLTNLGHRIMFANTKAYDRSLDAMIARIERDHAFKRSAQLRQILDRGHRHAVSAFAILQKIDSASASSSNEPAGLRYNFELATLLDQRGRRVEARDRLKDLIERAPDTLGDDEWFKEKHLGLIDASQRLLASFLMTRENYTEAIEVLKTILVDEDDGDYEVDRMLAECYAAMGRDDEMLAIAEEWLAKDQTFASLNFLVGQHLLRKQKATEALPYLEKASSRRSYDAEYSINLAKCYLELRRFDNASTALDRLIAKDQDNVELYLLRMKAMEGQGWIPDVTTFVVTALNRHFPDYETVDHKLLRDALNKFLERHDLTPKDLFQASELYDQDPRNHEVAVRLLELLVKKGDLERAAVVSEEALSICPSDDPSYYGLQVATAEYQEARENWSEASNSYANAARADPAAVAPYLGQARTSLKANDIGAAWRALAKAEILTTQRAETRDVRFLLHQADEDWGLAAEVGRELIAASPNDRDLLVRVTEVHTKARDVDGLEELLRKLDEQRSNDPMDWIDMAELQLNAALLAKGKQRERLQRSGSRQFGRAAAALINEPKPVFGIARTLSRHGLHREATGILKQLVVAHPQSIESLKLLAKTSLLLEDVKGFQDAVASVIELGDRAWALEHVLQECLKRGALAEASSILESISQDGQLTTPLLRLGIELRIAEENPEKARQLLSALAREESSSALELSQIRARILASEGRDVDALKALKQALKLAKSAADIQTIHLSIIENLGKSGQPESLITFAAEQIEAGGDGPVIMTATARQLVISNEANALEAIDQAISSGQVTNDLLFMRSLLQLRAGQTEVVVTCLSGLLKSKRSLDTGWVLAIAASLRGDDKTAAAATSGSGNYRPGNEIRAIIRFLRLMRTNRDLSVVQGALDAIDLGSQSERNGVKKAVSETFGNPAERARLRVGLGLYLCFKGIDLTHRMAADAANRLAADFPKHARAFRLMEARAKLLETDTYRQGIQTATALLADNENDEAALLIYAGAYIKSGNARALNDLLSWSVLQTESTATVTFRSELAELLMAEGYSTEASLVLAATPTETKAQRQLLALALFRSGKRVRAAHTLTSADTMPARDALWHLIVGASLAEEESTLQRAFQLVSNAVYRFGSTDPMALLVLAEVAAKIGNTAEAEKNLRRFVAQSPWSARAARRALQVIQDDREFDFPFRRWLETRSFMLDPSGIITASDS